MFDECVKFCKKDGAFIPTTKGCCPSVDLVAQRALRTVSWRCARCVVRVHDETTRAGSRVPKPELRQEETNKGREKGPNVMVEA